MGLRIDELPATVSPNRGAALPSMFDGLTTQLLVSQLLGLSVAGDVGFTPESGSALTGTTVEEIIAELDAAIVALTSGKQASAANLSTLAGLASIANLSALAGLTGAADKGVRFTGAGAMAVFDQTAFGRTLAGLANAAALRGAAEIASGTWAPTCTGIANVDGTPTATVCRYIRVGNIVSVSGWMSVDPTASGTPTTVRFSLPIPSAFADTESAAGAVTTGSVSGSVSGTLYSNAENDELEFSFRPGSTGAHTVSFSGHYTIV